MDRAWAEHRRQALDSGIKPYSEPQQVESWPGHDRHTGQGGKAMANKGKRDKFRRETQKKAQLSLKEKRKLKKEKKDKTLGQTKIAE